MSTSTMHISLPESLKQFVKEQVEKDHYSNPSDYMRALIRAEQKRQAEKRLEEMLLEGLESGPGMTLDSPEWDAFWERIEARIESKVKAARA
jgi:antitoxin ParD1/3/4